MNTQLKLIALLLCMCILPICLYAADDELPQANLVATMALKHTMQKAHFGEHDKSKMFGVTTDNHVVLYDIEKQQCMYDKLFNDVRSVCYYDDTHELLVCDHVTKVVPGTRKLDCLHFPNSCWCPKELEHYVHVNCCHLNTQRQDMLYQTCRLFHSFRCSVSYNEAKDKLLITDPERFIEIGDDKDNHRWDFCDEAKYLNDKTLLLIRSEGSVRLYDIATRNCTTIYRCKDTPRDYAEHIKSIAHNKQKILLHTDRQVVLHDIASGQQSVIVRGERYLDTTIRNALFHTVQGGDQGDEAVIQTKGVLLLHNHQIVVKDYEGKTQLTIPYKFPWESFICATYQNMVLLLNRWRHRVDVCDLEKKQLYEISKIDAHLGRLLQAEFCNNNKFHLITENHVLTYDICK